MYTTNSLACDSPSNAIWFLWMRIDGGIYGLWSLQYNKYNYGMGNFLLEFRETSHSPSSGWFVCLNESEVSPTSHPLSYVIREMMCPYALLLKDFSPPHCQSNNHSFKTEGMICLVQVLALKHLDLVASFKVSSGLTWSFVSGNITTTWTPKPLKSSLSKKLQAWGQPPVFSEIVKHT